VIFFPALLGIRGCRQTAGFVIMVRRMSEETIVYRGSPSIFTRFGSIFLSFLVAVAGFALYFTVGNAQPQLKWAFAGLGALALFFMLGTIVLVKATRYEITNERIRLRKGILTKRTDEMELYRANDTSLIEPLSLRMLGLGTIEIRTNDATTPTLHLHAIRGARRVREELRRYIEECRDKKRVRVTEFENPGPDA
jgi:uncharacterized membrane protein YdbT with pleckstrin-like domain